jgi:methylated-DNA-[protein]-cysteine S-methyltransferase
MSTDFAAIVSAPGFALGIHCDNDWLTEIIYLPPQAARRAKLPLAMETARQLQAYLADPTFAFSLPLQPAGTIFQRRVWSCISAIPAGQTRSYGDLAKELRSAPRAVGQACGANPYPLITPCHRVVAASKGLNNGLGGFAHDTGGLLIDIKRWLLAHEARR